LIQQGAGLVVCAQDVLDNMPMLATRAVLDVEGTEAAASSVQLSRMARSILRQLDGYGQCLDDIAAALKQNPQEVSLAMVELELAGFVRLGGDGYIRAS
jgi:predicted Rossmann fold nucleotide-binding protein DprA/Smf involved in DNA uptake